MDDFIKELDAELSDMVKPIPIKKTKADEKKKVPVKKSFPKKQVPQKKSQNVNEKRKAPNPVKKTPIRPTTKIKNSRTNLNDIQAPFHFPSPIQGAKLPKIEKGNTRIIPVGGLKTVGSNMNMVQYGDQIILIDGGMEFASNEMHGADYSIPDIRFLIPESKKILGMFITHGHLDHIGGLKNIIPALGFPPIYAAPFTLAIIKKIFAEAGLLNRVKLIPVHPKKHQLVSYGDFKIEFFPVNHTIPDSCGLYIETPNAKIVHMGDYKVDFSPIIDSPTDLPYYAELGRRNIDFLLQETTNSTKIEWTTSESKISGELEDTIRQAKDRIIIGNFSTLISRIQNIVNIAEKVGRYIFINGRSMVDHVAIAREMGILKCKNETIKVLSPKILKDIPDNRIIIISTGAQGEEYGGVGLMSRGDHKMISLRPRDTVILSSSIIPGNEVSIINMINGIVKHGSKIITIKEKEVHSGGHGTIAEQRVILNLIQPKYIIPIHGDIFMRNTYKKEAMQMGYDPKNILMLEDGSIIESNNKRELIKTRQKIPMEVMIVDGKGIGTMNSHIIKDRSRMRNSGTVIIIYQVKKDRSIDDFIKIETRGFVYSDESKSIQAILIKKARSIYEETLESTPDIEEKNLFKHIRSDMEKFISKSFVREPIVIPIFLSK